MSEALDLNGYIALAEERHTKLLESFRAYARELEDGQVLDVAEWSDLFGQYLMSTLPDDDASGEPEYPDDDLALGDPFELGHEADEEEDNEHAIAE